MDRISSPVVCYRGKDVPRWRDINPGQCCYRGCGVVSCRNDLMCGPLTDLFTRLCTISADTSQVTRQSKKGTIGEYYIQDFEIVLLCGLTELQAQLRWFEKASEDRENLYLLSCFADARIGGGEERAG